MARAYRRRRAKVRAFAVALGLFTFLSAEAFGVDAVFMEGRGFTALAAAAKDPLSLIAKRSPGGRIGDLKQLKNTKKPPNLAERGRQKPPPAPETPVAQQDLPPPAPVFAIREPVPPPPATPETAFPLTLAPPTPGPEEGGPGAPGGGDTGGPPGGVPIVGIPGGGGGGGGGPPGTPVIITTEIPPGTPGIPEPSVWATLIVGFFGIGAALRLRRRQRGNAGA